jgi:hypothetical protein
VVPEEHEASVFLLPAPDGGGHIRFVAVRMAAGAEGHPAHTGGPRVGPRKRTRQEANETGPAEPVWRKPAAAVRVVPGAPELEVGKEEELRQKWRTRRWTQSVSWIPEWS